MECRVCGEEDESLRHIWACPKSREGMEKEWVREVEEKGLICKGEKCRKNLIAVFEEELNENICRYVRNFEVKVKGKIGRVVGEHKREAE